MPSVTKLAAAENRNLETVMIIGVFVAPVTTAVAMTGTKPFKPLPGNITCVINQ
jgi:hypothetical protein